MKTVNSGNGWIEEYWINQQRIPPWLENIDIYAFCHSCLKAGVRLSPSLRPYVLISFTLKGNSRLGRPGFVFIHDLSSGNSQDGSFQINEDQERYFILLHTSPFLETLIARMFPNLSSDGLLRISDPDKIQRSFENIRSAMEDDLRLDPAGLSGLLFQLLSEIQQDQAQPKYSPELEKAVRFITRHLADPELCLESAAAGAGMGVRSLTKQFRLQMKTSFVAYVTCQRLERVRQMLQFSGKFVSQIAEDCGFSHPYYMIWKFRKTYGETPLQYRKKYSILRP